MLDTDDGRTRVEMIEKQCFICKEIIKNDDPAVLQMNVLDDNNESISINKFVCDDCEKFMDYFVEKTEGLIDQNE